MTNATTNKGDQVSGTNALPVAAGYYADKDGMMWELREGDPECQLDPQWAPYRLMRPVDEVAAEVLRAVRDMHSTDDPAYWDKLDALTRTWATK